MLKTSPTNHLYRYLMATQCGIHLCMFKKKKIPGTLKENYLCVHCHFHFAFIKMSIHVLSREYNCKQRAKHNVISRMPCNVKNQINIPEVYFCYMINNAMLFTDNGCSKSCLHYTMLWQYYFRIGRWEVFQNYKNL